MAGPSALWDDGRLNLGEHAGPFQKDSPPQRGRLSAPAGEAASRDGEDVCRRRGGLSPGGTVHRGTAEEPVLDTPDTAEADRRAPGITEDKLLETDEWAGFVCLFVVVVAYREASDAPENNNKIIVIIASYSNIWNSFSMF